MLTTVLMFLAAVLLSTIAGYYSVIGITAIFSGAFLPVLLMAGTLEASKVIVASWLYNNWHKTPILLKSYLTVAVLVLMFITSMGIFGFLSKAHIQQAAVGAQSNAQIERLSQEIDTQNKIIEMATKRVEGLMSGGQGGDASINLRITQANKLIDSATARVQPRIDDQQKIIDLENAKVESRVSDIQSQIADIDKQVAALDDIIKGLVDQQRSVLAQKKRAEQAKERDALAKRKAELLKTIDEVRNAPNQIVDAAKAEIDKIRSGVEGEIKQARDVINTLTSELGKNVDTSKIQTEIDDQNNRIKTASARLDELTTEKFNLETQTRALEVEVGPIKYITQLIYGDVVDMNMLERAVRYMILTLIFVFDPLAILMLIASNQGMAEWKAMLKEKTKKRYATIDVANEEPLPKIEPNERRASPIEIQASDDDSDDRAHDELTVDEPIVDAIIEDDGNATVIGTTDDSSQIDSTNTTDTILTPSVVNDTEELLNKLKKSHEIRLQRYNASSSNDGNMG